VKPKLWNSRPVKDGLAGDPWVLDIAGSLSVDAIVQYLKLWAEVRDVALDVGSDTFRWKWTSKGSFTARSAYLAMSEGSVAMAGVGNVCNSFAPMKHKLHGWLALRRHCWTADRLLRRGLPSHILCPLCKVHNETLDHLSLDCPFARVVWAGINSGLRVLFLTPTVPLLVWWPAAIQGIPVDRAFG
jgi:hypothetical protein